MSSARRKPFRRAMRACLRPLGRLLPLPVRSGPLNGRRLLAVSPMRFFRGTYEPEQTELFASLIGPGDVVYDVGAHVGWHTLIASEVVGADGQVVAFEPHPENAWILRRHIELNNLSNTILVQAAAAEETGTVAFDLGSGTGTGRMSAEGRLRVPCARIDDLVRDRGLRLPDLIKIDVEGSEDQVMAGAMEAVSAGRPTILLHTHGIEQLARCQELLCPLGYGQPRADVPALWTRS